MTRARNLAGLGTVTAQPTVTTPVHLGPLGVGTFSRIYGTWEHDQINSVSIGTTQLQISGITTGLNVSGIITAQNGLDVTGNIVNGLNVSAGIATLQALTATTGTFTGNVSIAGTLTYEDITDIDSVGVGTFRKGIIVAGLSTFNSGLNVTGNIVNGLNVSAGVATFQSVQGTSGSFSGDLDIAQDIRHIGDTNTKISFSGADTIQFTTGGTARVQVDDSATTLNSDVSIADKIIHTGDTNTAIRFPAADTFTVETSGTEAIRVDSNGDVGIGTAPNNIGSLRTLDICGPSGEGAGVRLRDSSDTADSTDFWLYKNYLAGYLRINGTDPLIIYLNSAERVRIDSDGKMGLGVTPTGIFDIREDNNPQLTLRANSHADNGGGRLNFGVGVAFAPQDGNTVCSIASTIHSTSGGTLKGHMKFYTNGGDDLEERMRIDDAGNVLIGTTSATSEFTVKGAGTVAAFEGTGGSGSIMLKDVDDGTLAYALVDAGNFDIQTSGSSYSTKLRVTPAGDVECSGTIDDSKGDVRNIPNVSKTSAYTLVATDGGKAIHITTGGVTVPNAVFAGGEAVTIVNSSNSNQTITQGSSLTMYLGGDAGTSGNRTLAGRGVATVWFHNGSTAYISGSGLS